MKKKTPSIKQREQLQRGNLFSQYLEIQRVLQEQCWGTLPTIVFGSGAPDDRAAYETAAEFARSSGGEVVLG